MKGRGFDLRHPFFAPLWRRVATVAVAGGWALVEFASGAPFWGILFGAIALWCGYAFFIDFDPDDYREDDQ